MIDQQSFIGKRFGKLVCIAIAEPFIDKKGYPNKRMLCRCDCGRERMETCSNLLYRERNGRMQNCGICHKKERTTHGAARRGQQFEKTYRVWRAMCRRCRDPKLHNYHRYGGRGIKVDERWLDYAKFRADMGECPSEDHTIERLDKDGNYCPENCCWLEKAKQQQNTSTNRMVTVNGITGCLAEMCRIFNVPYQRTLQRLRSGKTDEKSFFGTRCSQKLELTDVHRIRSLAGSATHAELASQFNVSPSLITQIINNKVWVAQDEPPKPSE